MITLRHFSTLGAVSGAALLAATTFAHAGAFGIREQSATALGLSFAGAASGSGGLSSTYWNPATVTMAPGFQMELHVSAIAVSGEIERITSPTAAFGNSGELGQVAPIASTYTSFQVNDRLFIGLSTSTPFGLVTDPRFDYAGALYGRSSKVLSLNANAFVGFKVTDWLSVAGGPVIQLFDIRLKGAVAASPLSNSAILDGDNVGFGYTAGVTLTPFAGTRIGLGYRSFIQHELNGSLQPGIPGVEIPIKANVNLPELVTFGISQAITPDFTLHGGVEFTNWSRLTQPAVVSKINDTVLTSIPFNYDDGWYFSLGGEYKYNDQWTFRAGVAYEMSPIDTQIRSPRLPDNDRLQVSLGAGYKLNEKMSFDVSYAHIFIRDAKINIVPGHQSFVGLPFQAESEPSIDILSFAVKMRLDDPAKPLAAALPVIRK